MCGFRSHKSSDELVLELAQEMLNKIPHQVEQEEDAEVSAR